MFLCCMSHTDGHPIIVVTHTVLTCGVCVHTDQRVEGLRRVVIPRDLTYRFLLLADSNTARGIETCGVLCGKLVRHALLSTQTLIYFILSTNYHFIGESQTSQATAYLI